MPLSNTRNTYDDFSNQKRNPNFIVKLMRSFFPGPNGSNAFLPEYDHGRIQLKININISVQCTRQQKSYTFFHCCIKIMRYQRRRG